MQLKWQKSKTDSQSDIDEFDDEIKLYKDVITKQEKEINDLKAKIDRKDQFIENLLMKIIEQAKPMARTPSAAELYVQKRDGATAPTTASVKELGKPRLPG